MRGGDWIGNPCVGDPHAVTQPRGVIVCDDAITKPDWRQTFHLRKCHSSRATLNVIGGVDKSGSGGRARIVTFCMHFLNRYS
jgi:hypothetical protein